MQKRLNGNNVRLRFVDRVADFHITILVDATLLDQNVFDYPSLKRTYAYESSNFYNRIIPTISWRLQSCVLVSSKALLSSPVSLSFTLLLGKLRIYIYYMQLSERKRTLNRYLHDITQIREAFLRVNI